MPLFTYEGEQELVFPSLGVTVNYGDTFEAPEDFTAANVVPATGKKATKNATATTVSEDTQPSLRPLKTLLIMQNPILLTRLRTRQPNQ
jgi:hypothetical protein